MEDRERTTREGKEGRNGEREGGDGIEMGGEMVRGKRYERNEPGSQV